jgi:hypothetical protein
MSNASNPIETLAGCLAHAAYEAFPEYKYQDRNWALHDRWRATLSREELMQVFRILYFFNGISRVPTAG